MSETVKLIIEISKEDIELIRKTSFVEDERTMFKQSPSDRQGTMMLFRLMDSVKDGTPLDSNSEKAEVQAYFDGQAYGWEQGRKALIDDVKAEILQLDYTTEVIDYDCGDMALSAEEHMISRECILQILDNIGKKESEDKE